GKGAQQRRKEVSDQHKHRLLLPTIPFAEIAEEGEVAATANSTSVRANFFSFPTNGFRRGTHFHFVRGQFPLAAEESGAQARRPGQRNRRGRIDIISRLHKALRASSFFGLAT